MGNLLANMRAMNKRRDTSALVSDLGGYEREMYRNFSQCVVNILCFSDGIYWGHLSGFTYSLLGRSLVIVTCSDCLKTMPGKPTFRVRLCNEQESSAEYLFHSDDPDMMCLQTEHSRLSSGSSRSSSSAPSVCSNSWEEVAGGYCFVGEPVFLLGYAGHDQREVAYSKGSMRTAVAGSATVTATADFASSGGPCFTLEGRLVGMVKGSPPGQGIGGGPSVAIVEAACIDALLRFHNLPGLHSGVMCAAQQQRTQGWSTGIQ